MALVTDADKAEIWEVYEELCDQTADVYAPVAVSSPVNGEENTWPTLSFTLPCITTSSKLYGVMTLNRRGVPSVNFQVDDQLSPDDAMIMFPRLANSYLIKAGFRIHVRDDNSDWEVVEDPHVPGDLSPCVRVSVFRVPVLAI